MSVNKSIYDEKEYRVITLSNGLTALLVSESKLAHPHTTTSDCSSDDDTDSESDEYVQVDSRSRQRSRSHSDTSVESKGRKEGKNLNCAACGLCVRIGSFHDPPEIPGLAHLLEHMLFMGSEKYSCENEFDKYISQHGGMCNASTDYETTLFYFSVNRKAFKESIDKFAHFFVSPLLNPSSLEREIEAVDSEFQASIQSDSHRIQQLFSSLAIDGHPLNCFPWGNGETLKDKDHPKDSLSLYLRDFYTKYYSASCMTVTVVSEDSLDFLEECVRESFSSIPTHNKTNPNVAHCQPVFNDSIFHQIYKVVPVKSVHKVTLSWILPSLLHEYKAKPTDYLGWLLGHEGYGSVISHLKKRNLATDIVAGTSGSDSEMNSCFTLFSCTLTLTEKGTDNIFECITVVFQYLKMLQEQGPQQRIYEELKAIEENEFNFCEEEDAIDLAERLCESMQFYPPEHYLTGNELYMEYNDKLISSITEYLVPCTCNIMITSPKFTSECNLKEKWFGTLYTNQPVSDNWTMKWKDLPLNTELYLPPPNEFIASEFSLIEPDIPQSEYPVCIEETLKHKLWYKRDDMFKLPRASFNLLFTTPVHSESIENAVLMELFVKLYNSTLMELGYEAKVAQLDYSLTVAYRGLSLSMSGLNHKLPDLFQTLVRHFSNFMINEDQFEIAVDQLQQNYDNLSLKPTKLCKFYRLQILEKRHFPISQRAKILKLLKLNDFKMFTTQLKSKLFIEALIQGNITAIGAKQLMEILWNLINCDILPTDCQFSPKCLRLPSNSTVTLITNYNDPNCPNTVLTDYYQCSVADPREVAMAQLLVSCIEEPCFDSLRTKQQLGYTVYVTMHYTHNVTGLSLNVVTQGTKFSYQHVSKCMDDFMYGFLSVLNSWTENDFQSHVESLVDDLEEDDTCLDDEVSRNWGEILTQCYIFERLKKQVKCLKHMSKTKACKWFERYTHPGENYRRLNIKVVSDFNHDNKVDQLCNGRTHLNNNGGTSCKQIIIKESDIDSFKSTLKQYPRGPV